jgi:hypothetical protein
LTSRGALDDDGLTVDLAGPHKQFSAIAPKQQRVVLAEPTLISRPSTSGRRAHGRHSLPEGGQCSSQVLIVDRNLSRRDHFFVHCRPGVGNFSNVAKYPPFTLGRNRCNPNSPKFSIRNSFRRFFSRSNLKGDTNARHFSPRGGFKIRLTCGNQQTG